MAATPSPGPVCPKRPRAAALLALALAVLPGVACDDTVTVTVPDLAFDPAPPPDFRGRTAYEIFLRSFADSDGDGVGDLKGLTAHLDDLNDGRAGSTTSLGVDAIWLTPVFPSPVTIRCSPFCARLPTLTARKQPLSSRASSVTCRGSTPSWMTP